MDMGSGVSRFLKAQRVQVSSTGDILEVPLSWLDGPRHIDEAISFVPIAPEAEDAAAFALLAPSPELAVDLLHRSMRTQGAGGTLRMGFYTGYNRTMTVREALVEKRNGHFLETALEEPVPDTTSPRVLKLKDGIEVVVGDVLRVDDEYVLVTQREGDGQTTNTIEVDRLQVNNELRDRHVVQGPRLRPHGAGARVYVLTERCRLSIFGEVTPGGTRFPGPQACIDKMLEDLKSHQGLGMANLSVIRVPVLYEGTEGGFRACTANFVNCLVAGGKAVMQHQHGPSRKKDDKEIHIFEEFVEGVFKDAKASVAPEFIDWWNTLHMKGGAIHCGSNAKRKPLEVPWWQAWR